MSEVGSLKELADAKAAACEHNMNLTQPSKDHLKTILHACNEPNTFYALCISENGDVSAKQIEGELLGYWLDDQFRFYSEDRSTSCGCFFGSRASANEEYVAALFRDLVDAWDSGFRGKLKLPIVSNPGLSGSEDRLLNIIAKRLTFVHNLLAKHCAVPRDVLDRYEKCFKFGHMSGNPKLEWSNDLLGKHVNDWDWPRLSGNPGLPWSDDLVTRFSDRWDWQQLSANPSLPWSEAFIDRYKHKWNWFVLTGNCSIPWSEAIIDKFLLKWGWSVLCQNPSVKWNAGMIDKYSSHLLSQKECFWNMSKNANVNWNCDLIDRYSQKWNWESLGGNPGLPWSLDFIDRYHLRLFEHEYYWSEERYAMPPAPEGISGNIHLPWNDELIERYKDRWDWTRFGLSRNPALPWNESLLERYRDRWEWGEHGLSCNHKLPWTERLIHTYAARWCWGKNGLSDNVGLPWNGDLISSFTGWDFNALAHNAAVPWTDQLVRRYFGRLKLKTWPMDMWLHPCFSWSLHHLKILINGGRYPSALWARARQKVIMPLMSDKLLRTAVSNAETKLTWFWSEEAQEERRMMREIEGEIEADQYWADKEDAYLQSDEGLINEVFDGDADAYWNSRE